MKKPSKYNASLQAASELSEEQRTAAEQKYIELLEKKFGSASKVRGAYCEWLAVRSLHAENPWDEPSPQELQAIALWEKASAEASKAVFSEQEIKAPEAFFELHVWNSRTY